MDSSAKEFTLNENGCNFCTQALASLERTKKERHKLPEILAGIKSQKGEYNCLIGLSGGVDSSMVLHKAIEFGLKPLCFSIDNGWNSPKADENIMKMVETLKVPFFRYNIDQKIFKELQGAFIKAGQKNIEIPTDHILGAITFQIASEYGITNVLSGGNVATESIMPFSWGYHARDLRHIKDIYKWATGKRLKGLPVCSIPAFNYYKWIKKIRTIYLLDYIEYNRNEAIRTLKDKYNWQEYGNKHEESTFTWWFQNFYLFEKFGIDKRKPHFSSLIVSGQMTRKEAMALLEQNPIYPELGIEKKVLAYPKREYTDFKTSEKLFNFIGKVIKLLR